MSPISKKRKLNGLPENPSPPQEPQAEPDVERDAQPDAEDEPSNSPAASAKAVDNTPSFADLGIIPQLCDACVDLGYKKPTPIQAEAIPIALEGRDVIGVAETGSGKTCAFALPILQALMENPHPLFGLVLAPTRELAYQISKQFDALGKEIQVRCVTIVGGMSMTEQAIALSKRPHIVVASPGRLLDHLENTKGFNLRNLKYLVLDEADRLLDLDFGDAIIKILKVLPQDTRRTYLFSATMSNKVGELQRASLKNPVRVAVSDTNHQLVANLVNRWILIPEVLKTECLVYLLSYMFKGKATIVFAREKRAVSEITYLLRDLGLSAITIHGDLSQAARLAALNKFRVKSRTILVATDVAGRGLDIPSVDLVINYDLPDDSKTFVHKVGRTARAGQSGMAVSLVTQYNVEQWLRIEKALDQKIAQLDGVDMNDVKSLTESVSVAKQEAKRKVKEDNDKGGRRGGFGSKGKKRKGDDRDRDRA